MKLKGTFSCFLAVSIAVFAIHDTAYCQAFTQAPGAETGIVTFGTGQGLYGGFGLDSANDPEFNIYRKYLDTTEEPLSSATNVEGNPGEIHWVDVNQRQGAADGATKRVLTAPGMFIGQENHTTEDGWVVSNPDQVLYFKPLLDQEEDQAAIVDSNRNAIWDVRFGFMEDPEAYIDFASPNSNELDLWTGQFNSDAVYGQVAISRDDQRDSTNVHTAQNHGGSFQLQSGSPFTEINDERDRDDYEMARTVAGSGAELERTGFSDAGVAYEDAVEVTWGMRLADPDSTNMFESRTVEFWIKTGNIITSGTFDPGAEGSFPQDPPNENDFEDYTDGWFDWTIAKPVFFAGAQGLVQGEGNMGFFIPGDFGADGSVGVEDFTRLAADFGGTGTTYSRGDITQDGITDLADATAWAELASPEVRAAATSAVSDDLDAGGSIYDFDGSGATDSADLSFVSELLGIARGECNPATMGDIDGSGDVAFADFLILSQNFGQTGTDHRTGDIDCSGEVAFADFLILSLNFGQTVGGAQSVPEPSGAVLHALAALSLGLVRRRRLGVAT